jgi:hypothetical protein
MTTTLQTGTAEAVEIPQSRGKLLVGFAISAAFLAGCLWLWTQGDPSTARGGFARYVATPIFALVFLVWLKNVLTPATLVLCPEGVRLRQVLGGFSLPWSDIAHHEVVNPYWVEKVQFRLANGKKKALPAAWSRTPAEVNAAIAEARARWSPG